MPRQPKKGQTPGRLRIVAGKWRGRRLPVIAAEGLRPTSERVRETLFNWLMLWIPGKRCLDLFAGSGALGFEALSREAASCLFVETDQAAVRVLRDNVRTLEATAATVTLGDAYRVLDTIDRASIDLVFLDPPFAGGDPGRLCSLVDESGILGPGARVYLETSRDAPEPQLPDGWEPEKSSIAGNVRYSLFGTGHGSRE